MPEDPITVRAGVTVSELSHALGVRMPEIIKILMTHGSMRTAQESLPDEDVQWIADGLGRRIEIR